MLLQHNSTGAELPHSQAVFSVLATWEIRDRLIYRTRIWQPAQGFDISRVQWLDALTELYAYDGRIFWKNGRPFNIPEVDDVFNDPENRWMSYFLEADSTGAAPQRYCRIIPRLRLIALFCDVMAAQGNSRSP